MKINTVTWSTVRGDPVVIINRPVSIASADYLQKNQAFDKTLVTHCRNGKFPLTLVRELFIMAITS